MCTRYSVNGRIHKLWHADYQAAKSSALRAGVLSCAPQCSLGARARAVCLARVDTGAGIVDVYLTHLVASYATLVDTSDE